MGVFVVRTCTRRINVAIPTETFPSLRAVELDDALVFLILKHVTSCRVAKLASYLGLSLQFV